MEYNPKITITPQEDAKVKYDVNYIIYFENGDFIEIEGTLNPYDTGRGVDYEFEPSWFSNDEEEQYFYDNQDKIENDIFDEFYKKKEFGGFILGAGLGVAGTLAYQKYGNTKEVKQIKKYGQKGVKKIKKYGSELKTKMTKPSKPVKSKRRSKYSEGGQLDWFDFDKKMALINLGQIEEYSLKLDNLVSEDANLEDWVKMKLTRVEQNVADVKKSLEGWEKYSEGGRIFKKQLLHINNYAKDLIAMIQGGSKLMSWQENKLAISADYIDNIYHHLDYEMGNRASKMESGGETSTLINTLTNKILNIFPQSFVNVGVRKFLGESSIMIYFTLGKDKSEYRNNIIDNDDLYHSINISNVDENGNPKGILKVDLYRGGIITIKSSNPYLAYERIKIGWRNFSGTESQVITRIEKYFIKLKETLLSNRDKLTDWTNDLINKKSYEINFENGGGVRYSIDYFKMKQDELDEEGNTVVTYDDNDDTWLWEDYKTSVVRRGFESEYDAYDNLVDYLLGEYSYYEKGGALVDVGYSMNTGVGSEGGTHYLYSLIDGTQTFELNQPVEIITSWSDDWIDKLKDNSYNGKKPYNIVFPAGSRVMVGKNKNDSNSRVIISNSNVLDEWVNVVPFESTLEDIKKSIEHIPTGKDYLNRQDSIEFIKNNIDLIDNESGYSRLFASSFLVDSIGLKDDDYENVDLTKAKIISKLPTLSMNAINRIIDCMEGYSASYNDLSGRIHIKKYAKGGGVEEKYIIKRDEEHYVFINSSIVHSPIHYKFVRSKNEATIFNDIEKAKEVADYVDADVFSFDEKQMYEAGGGVGEIKVKDKVIWRGNEYVFSKIIENRINGMIDKKYHLDSYKIGVPNAILDSLKDVKKKMENGGGVGYSKKEILSFVKELKRVQNDILEYKKELNDGNISEWEKENIENNKLPELKVKEDYLIGQLQWGVKNYIFKYGKSLVLNDETYNFLKTEGIFSKGGGVGEPYDSMTKYQLEKELKKLNEKRHTLKNKYGNFESEEIIENEKEIDKIITLLYGENFSGVGQKYKYAKGGDIKYKIVRTDRVYPYTSYELDTTIESLKRSGWDINDKVLEKLSKTDEVTIYDGRRGDRITISKMAKGGAVDWDDATWSEDEAYSPYMTRQQYEAEQYSDDDLRTASKTFAKSSEILVKENLNNGEICVCKLKKIIGHEPNYPIQVVGSLTLTKCFLRPYYKI